MVWLLTAAVFLIYTFFYSERFGYIAYLHLDNKAYLSMIMVLAFVFLISEGDIIFTDNVHPWANFRNNSNPLYAGGYFRKNLNKLRWMAGLKGYFFCQMGIILFVAILIGYRIYGFLIWGSCRYHNAIVDNALLFSFYFFCIIRILHYFYYQRVYIRAFRYTENKRGIWKPFSNICDTVGWWKNGTSSFECNYYMPYERIKQNLDKTCKKSGYSFINAYGLEENEECRIYHKIQNGRLEIFQLIYMEQYKEEKTEKLNIVFEDYWLKHIEGKYKIENASIIFLLYVKQYNAALRRRFLQFCAVDQKKGRNRLPAVLVFSDYSEITIPPNCGKMHGKKEYKEMRAELLKLLDISEKYNHRHYGSREEYEEAKLKNILNEKY